jgi:hypothetical protein
MADDLLDLDDIVIAPDKKQHKNLFAPDDSSSDS